MDRHDRSFFDLYAHGMIRAAVAIPRVHLADPSANAAAHVELARDAAERGAAVTVFPELSITGYSLDDLLQQDALLDGAIHGLSEFAAGTAGLQSLLLVGAPLRFDGRLFNCAVVMQRGAVLGVVPKSYLPNYREFYEARHFSPARHATRDEVDLLGARVPFGADLIFRDRLRTDLAVHAEICEDLWVPVPPSTAAALRGATVLANLSASNVTIGKSAYRHQLAAQHSAQCLAAHLYAAAGAGESTTDLAWDGQATVYECGTQLAESKRFTDDAQLVVADLDLQRLVQERSRMNSFSECAFDQRDQWQSLREVPFAFTPPTTVVSLERRVETHPYVPADPSRRDERCSEALEIQVAGLAQRLRASGHEHLVIGVSGGLDSTLALLVSVSTMDRLGLPREHVHAVTMPGFATSSRTLEHARQLLAKLGVDGREIDITEACTTMLRDLGHPAATGEPVYDTTYENVQAGHRTSLLFRLANQHRALVVGTGDLSELALGWCTYGVGDQMSHYNVNTSIPKTLIRFLIDWLAEREWRETPVESVLRGILDTAISPELIPGGDDAGEPAQLTEDVLGPYELHDFTLYYLTRLGFGPAKIAFLCHAAWSASANPDQHSLEDIVRWQEVFLRRFFATSQFKRSASPNGPKVGSGGSLSPRGDWRAPSDSSAEAWLREWRLLKTWIDRSRTR